VVQRVLPTAFTTCVVVAIICHLRVWTLWDEIVLVLDT